MGNCSAFHNFHTSNKRQTKLRIARDDDDAGKVVVKGRDVEPELNNEIEQCTGQ